MSKKLPSNMGNTFDSLFYKDAKNFDLPVLLPKLQIGNNYIIRKNSVKFLLVILEERPN